MAGTLVRLAGGAVAWLAGGATFMLLAGAIEPAAGGPDYTVGTAAVRIQGMSEHVLTDVKGMTLYYLATDTPTHSTCTGLCAQVWPPLLSGSAPSSGGPLPGKLGLAKTENGSQVSYNGHLLYRYTGDTAPGQANGQGVAGQWRVAGIDLRPATSSGAGSPNRSIQVGEGGGRDGGGMDHGGGGY